MQKEINIPVILAAVKQAGDFFLKDYKKTVIPQNKAEMLTQLQAIEERCLAELQISLADDFPNPWRGAEFDYNEQRQPLGLTEYWLCDTMDGAIQYMQHLSGWTINLVLVRHGHPHFAVIYDPLAQEMFWAKEGAGAYLNNAPLKLSSKIDLEAMVAVFEYALQYTEMPGLNQKIGASISNLLQNFGIVRNYGPHGLQLAYIGAGRIDVFLQEDLDTYNWLAGILIAKEAGAEILTTDGRAWLWGDESLLVAAPGIGQRFLQAKSVSSVA